MRFSQEFIDKVRDANNIAEIIGQYTELKGSGHRLTGRCPFPDHADKSPSFSVTEGNQLFYCYGCKKGGNIFNFLELFNGMTFPEAVDFLARRASIPLPQADERPVKNGTPSRDQKDLFLRVNKLAAVFFHQQLKAEPLDAPVRTYLTKRGLTDEIVEKFRLGVALDDWQGLVRCLKAKGAPSQAAEALGLIKLKKSEKNVDASSSGGRAVAISSQANSNYESYFDLFRDRLMFPIFSSTGDVVGFGGRTLGDGLPKYVNSSDSPVFHKGKILYGLHETGKFIRAQDEVIVVEGYMDAISLYGAGIKNVVAILGTAFTPEHAKILKRYTLNVKMLLDGDEAGINGAERSLPILLEAGLMAKGFTLPESMDPDDYVRAHGPEQLRVEIARAPELFSLLLMRRWMQGYHGSASEKVQIVAQAAQALKRMQNRQLLELYLLELSQQLDVESGWLRRTLNQAVHDRLAKSPQREQNANFAGGAEELVELENLIVPQIISVKKAPRDEAFVLSLLLQHEHLMKELLEAGPEGLLQIIGDLGIRQVLGLAIEKYRQRRESFASLAASLASQIDQPSIVTSSLAVTSPTLSYGTGSNHGRSARESGDPSGSEKRVDERGLMSDYLNAIRKRYLKNQLDALAYQLRDQSNPENSPEKLLEKLEQFMNIQRDRLSLNRDK